MDIQGLAAVQAGRPQSSGEGRRTSDRAVLLVLDRPRPHLPFGRHLRAGRRTRLCTERHKCWVLVKECDVYFGRVLGQSISAALVIATRPLLGRVNRPALTRYVTAHCMRNAPVSTDFRGKQLVAVLGRQCELIGKRVRQVRHHAWRPSVGNGAGEASKILIIGHGHRSQYRTGGEAPLDVAEGRRYVLAHVGFQGLDQRE